MLAIGAAMLGAAHVLGVDCDEGALEVAADNCDAFDGITVGFRDSLLMVPMYLKGAVSGQLVRASEMRPW